MMARLTIRTRLILLSSALLFVFVATNVYLTRKLADNSAAVAEVADLIDVIQSANGARVAFGELRYWLTDLAVSLLILSERNAAAAREPGGPLPSCWASFACRQGATPVQSRLPEKGERNKWPARSPHRISFHEDVEADP